MCISGDFSIIAKGKSKMVQKTFGIYGETDAPLQLTIEAGRHHFACWQKEIGGDETYAFELFQFSPEHSKDFNELFNEIKSQSRILHLYHDDVRVIWQHEEALYIPRQYFHNDIADDYLFTAFGNLTPTFISHEIAGDVIVLYRADEESKKTLLRYAARARFTHKYFLLLNEYSEKKEEMQEDYLQLQIYPNHFIMMVVKQKQLQLVNTFKYQTPEDVLYHVLNVCQQLDVDKAKTIFYFSGLIDLESNLYKELDAYLLNIKVISISTDQLAATGFQEYPSHYFSSFFNIFS